MKNKLKISIVTVSFNCASIIEDTLKSVIGQSYSNLEYIIIDGSSMDNTLNIVNVHSEKIAKIISEPDKGIFDAMNKALQYVTGDYVLFLNAGDRFVNNHVVADIFEGKDYSADLIYGDTYIETVYGYKLSKANAIYDKNPSAIDMVFVAQGFCHQSLFTKVPVLKNIGFNLAYPLGADYDTTAKVYFQGNHELFYVGFPIAVFDDRQGGASHNRIKQVLDERIMMFNPRKSVVFYWQYCKTIMTERVKSLMALCVPKIVERVRKRKYINSIE